MKKIIIWGLIIALLLGIGVGAFLYFNNNEPSETPSTNSGVTKADLEAALAYIKTVYKNPSEKTPRDFQRIGTVPVNGQNIEVVWSVDVGEEHVKVVKGDDGMVTIDVNEQSAVDVKYVLTATVTNGTDSVSFSWNHLLPMVNNDMAAIVEEAYQLEVGASMDYEVTLTGVITRVNTAYDPNYGNITVTIEVAGAEGKPIECYRLKGDGVEDLQIGDTITVTGTLKNYNGKIEFDQGCILDAVVKGEAVDAPTDILQILQEAYALEDGKALPYVATLTGKITTINTVYNPAYGNVSVTIVVDGYTDYPILCYRIAGEGADSLLIGDTITVKGYICNYAGKIEFEQGSQLTHVEKTGTEIEAPTDVNEILNAAFGLADGESLPYKATLTGVITKIKTPYDPGYKNVTVAIKVNGKTIECYRLAGDGADKIGVDDTITVTGYLMNYHDTIQFAQGCTLDSWKDTGSDIPPADENISASTVVAEIVTNPKAGTAYKFFLHQKTLGKNLYLTGNMDGFYYETSDNHEDAIDVFVEEVSGGYRLYFMKGGAKNYIEVLRQYSESTGKYHNNVIFTTNPTKTLKWNSTIKSFTIDLDVDGTMTTFYLGTYSSYQTMSASDIAKVTGENASTLEETNFVAHLATLKETKVSAEEKAFEELKSDYPGTTKPTNVTESFTRRAYYTVEGKQVNIKWTTDNKSVKIVDNGNGTVTVKITRGDKAVNFKLTATITGDETYTTSWDYTIPAKPSEDVPELPTTDGATITIEQALTFGAELEEYTTIKYKVTGKIVDVYNTQYGNMRIRDDKGNVLTIYGTYNEDGTVRYDELEVKPVAGDTVTIYGSLGQYNGVAQIKNGWIIEHIPGTGEDEPVVDMTMQEIVDAAYELDNGGILPNKHTLTGVITSVDTPYSDQYGNVTVTIVIDGRESKPIKCYRLAGDGADKINVGYTITVTGMLKNYNGTIEFDQGCTLDSYVKGEAPDVPVIPTTPATQPTTPSGGILVPETVTNPKTGKAYKFYLTQKNLGKTLYLTGEMNGYYFATTENHEEAVDVFVERVSGGYRLYFMKDGEKTYIEMARSGTHNNVIFTTEPAKTLKWNADINSYTCDLDVDGEITTFYFGTYGTYSTFSASKISYVTGDNADTMDETNFVAHLATMVETEAPVEPTTPATTPATTPTTPATTPSTTPATQPTEPAPGTPTYELIGQPSTGVAYKWAVDTGDAEGVLAFIGTTANKDYYLSTSATMAEGVDVYVEAVTGGYRMYFMAGTTKTYIDIYQNGTYVNARLTEEPTAVYTWNSTYNTFVADIGGTPYYLGTYTSSSTGATYTTLSASKLSYMNESNVNVTQFPARFYELTGSVEPQPTTPTQAPTVAPTEEPTVAPTEEPTVAPTEPAPGMTMQEIVDAAYELESGASMSETVTLTGVITRVNTPYDTGWQNVTVTITVEGREDKPIMCYRLSGEGADVIAVGDTITVTGTIKNYNGTIEFVQGCTLDSYVKGEAPEDPYEGLTMQELVDAAYALEAGGYIDGKTLTGVIIEVNTAYSEQHDNVTVTIVVEGREDKPIECYRLKGEGADVIAVGDTITVTGNLTNYRGEKIEFDQGCTLDDYVKAETPTDPTDPTEEPTEPTVAPTEEPTVAPTVAPTEEPTVAPTEEPTEEPTVAPTEPPVEPTKQKVDLTGTVVGACSGNAATANSYADFTWWSDGRPDWKPLGNFVDGDLTTYFSFGASPGERADLYLDLSKGGTGSTAVDEFTIYHSSQGDVPTIKVVLILEDGTEWTKTYETNWAQFGGNVSITEVLDETKNAVGMYIWQDCNASWQTSSTSAHFGDIEIYTYENGTTEPEPTEPIVAPTEEPTVAPTEPTEEPTVAPTEPAAEPSYNKITSLEELTNGKYVLVADNGKAPTYWENNWVLAGDPVIDGDKITVANAEGFVWDITVDGSTITLTDSKGTAIKPKTGNNNGILSGTYSWTVVFADGTFQIKGTGTDTTIFAFNTDSQYLKFRAYKSSTVTSYPDSYPCNFTLYKYEEGSAPVEPTEPTVAPTEPTVAPTEEPTVAPTVAPTEEPTVAPTEEPTQAPTEEPTVAPTEPAPVDPTYELVGQPSVGLAYKWAANTGAAEGILTFNGATGSQAYYLATVTTMTEGVDVYVEEVTGGYRMYFMSGETKTYIDIYQNGTYVNARLTDAPTAVYTWNSTYNTFVANIGGTDYYLGTYTKASTGVTYTTLSASKLSYMNESNVDVSQFPARFYAETTTVDPEPTVAPTEPATQAPTEAPTVAPTEEPTVAPTEAPTEEPTVAPTEPAAEPSYKKITTLDELTTGKYVLVVSNGYAPQTFSSGWLLSGKPTVSGDEITVANAEGYIWDITVNGTSVTLTDANGVTIKPKSGNNNGIQSGSYSWAVSCSNGTFKFAGTGSDTTTLAANTGSSNKFRAYKNTTVTGSNASTYPSAFTLYKLVEGTVAPEDPTEDPTEAPTEAPTEGTTEAPTEPVTEMTMVEIVDAAYELASGASMSEAVTLTGVVTRVNTAYDSYWENVTVTIQIEGREDKPIMCYRMKGTGADVVAVGYTITVTGTIKNYNGTIEFDAGCTLDSYVEGVAPEDPTAGMTMQEIVDYAYTLEAGGFVDGKTLTGTITEVNTAYDSEYENVTVTIVVEGKEDKPIKCYRMKGNGANMIGVGDTITVTGTLTNYNGTIEFDQGCTLDAYTLNQESGEQDPSDVNYVYGSYSGYSNVILNWGERGVVATGLSPNAKAFYTSNNTSYAALSALSGSSTVSSVPGSALYSELQELMVENHTKQTSYGDTRYLYCFTDCKNSDNSSISCFYTGNDLDSAWDGTTWNREHCWPKSKTEAGTANNSSTGEVGDIMTLRPTTANVNSSRGNKAYGESSGYHDPNGSLGSNGADLRGDVARIVLYTYVRWGNTSYMWGSEGVMESKDVLLDWIEVDPVDTWELGRNDSVESITGTRNVFVDYPELAFVLFGEEIPTTMTTPSGSAAA